MSVALLLCALAAAGGDPNSDWELVRDDGDVKIWRRETPGLDVVAFRGEGVVRAPIGKLVTISMTPSRYPEWTDMLVHVDVLSRSGPYDLVVREIYDQPWPVSDRDFVYHTLGTADAERRSFTVRYNSVQRRDGPENDCCVRGEIHHSFLRFTAQLDGTTKVELEALVDPKGWLPTWLVNMVQKDWPKTTLEAFRLQAQKPDVVATAGYEHWHEAELASAPAPAADTAN